MIATPLFEGQLVRLAPIDPERDGDTFSRWSHDPEFPWQMDDAPVRPLTVAQARRRLETLNRDDKNRTAASFAIRTREGDRLVGLVRLFGIAWTNGAAELGLGIGAAEDWEQDYAGEALGLLLHYAFAELNLYRLEVKICEESARTIRALAQAGFSIEVRRRQAIHRKGVWRDLLHLGLLREEWESSVVNQTTDVPRQG